jgi:cell volume regulation protein A
MVLSMAVELSVGLLCGAAFGHAGRWLLPRLRLTAAGLYPVFTLALAFATFGATTVLHGSGFLAVYLAALLVGSAPMPYQAGVRRVHDSIAWLAQVAMFLLMGLMVLPSQLARVAVPGLGIALLLALVARPLAVALCLLPFRVAPREGAFISWAGLRGAAPIVLATFPVLARAPGAEQLFQLVFFVVAVNALVPGATLGWATRWFDLESRATPPPESSLEIMSQLPVDGEILSFSVEEASAVAHTALRDLPFPPEASILLLVRGHRLVPARGGTVIEPGDHVHVFCRPEDEPFVMLLFGREA